MQKKRCLIVSDKRVVHKILLSEIIHVESKGMRCSIHMSCGAIYSCARNLGSLCRDLANAETICRVHTSFAVNLGKIVCVNKEKKSFVLMSNGSTIPVSKRRKSSFFRQYMGPG